MLRSPALSLLRRWGTSRAQACLAGAFCLLVFVLLSETLNEYVEHEWIKKGGFHNFMHTSKGRTDVPVQEELIVYVHVPRTSGETLKITLFNDVAYQFNPEWVDFMHCEDDCQNYWDCAPLAWLCHRKSAQTTDKIGPPKPWPWPGKAEEIQAQLQYGNVIMGFFSRNDIERLRNLTKRQLKLFTVIRHPLERSLSWLGMINSSCSRVPWAQTCADATPLAYYHRPPLVRTDVGERRHRHLSEHVVSYAHNSMTWQLGYQMHSSHRGVPERVALERAKEFLQQMDYVGFFEDMLMDYPRLKQTIFPHAKGNFIYSAMYMIGTVLGLPRMRTLKYLAHLNDAERQALEEVNTLDIELYEWAQARFGKQTTLYLSYSEFSLSLALPILATIVFICLLLKYLRVWRHTAAPRPDHAE